MQHRVAEGLRDLALRRDEVGGARAVEDVLVGGDRRVRRRSCRAGGRVPCACSTSRIFHARLSASCTPELAPRAPNGDTPWAASPANSTRPWRKLLHPQAREGVDAHPLEGRSRPRRPSRSPSNSAFTRAATRSGSRSATGVGIPAELEVDAPHVDRVGWCSSTDWPRWNGGSNQNQRSAAKRADVCGRHLHVGDQEAIAERMAFALQTEHPAHRRSRAVACDHVVARQAIRAVGGLDREQSRASSCHVEADHACSSSAGPRAVRADDALRTGSLRRSTAAG